MKTKFFPFLFLILFGCATTEETTELRFEINNLKREIEIVRNDQARKIIRTEEGLRNLLKNEIENIKKELETIRKQILDLSQLEDNQEERLKQIAGKMEEIGFELETYKKDTRDNIRSLEDSIRKLQELQKEIKALEERMLETEKKGKVDHSRLYRNAFDTFQNGRYGESVEMFSEFLSSFPDSPLVPNALFWKAEAYIKIKEFEKAILTLQELIEKYPKHERVPQAMLSQADAFLYMKDVKSSLVILKRLTELFPESDEAKIAMTKLKSLE